ncbi:MAG: hypothetical protein AUG51_24615 [Acidobacteria bacterium 13_1_20CM_3_53_8]|nr:MAG: hypothetical protein AUG51_24615 [Acidobacteria bacterium 13_1_20CM_3_53_8]
MPYKDPVARRKYSREYNRRRYNEDDQYRSAHMTRVVNSRRKSRKLLQEAIIKYLHTHPCVDCGEADVLVLDFDHVRGGKVFNISEAMHKCYGVATLMAEIAKCEVRCANCHRRRTAKVRGHWKMLF